MKNLTAKKGLTLLEMITICCCTILIMSLWIITLYQKRIHANEGAAIGSLRTISTSQEQFKNCSQVDQDTDGSGEFGLLGELAGTTSRRGVVLGTRVNPTFINPILGPKGINNYSIKSGYRFQVHLPSPFKTKTITDNGIQQFLFVCAIPDSFRTPKIWWFSRLPTCAEMTPKDRIKQGSAIKELLGVDCCPSTPGLKFVDAQETHYRTYAWPDEFNYTGVRCFAIDQAGEVVVASNQNLVKPYGGDNSPRFDAAVDKELDDNVNTFSGLIVARNITKDGQKWISYDPIKTNVVKKSTGAKKSTGTEKSIIEKWITSKEE